MWWWWWWLGGVNWESRGASKGETGRRGEESGRVPESPYEMLGTAGRAGGLGLGPGTGRDRPGEMPGTGTRARRICTLGPPGHACTQYVQEARRCVPEP